MAYSNVMRYTGTSGIDTTSMVEAMMKVEAMKYDTLFKKNVQYTYKQEAYQSVGNKLIDIQKANLDALATGTLRKSSTFKSSKSTVTNKSGATSGSVSVKLGSSSKNFSSKVTVNSLATAQKSTFKANNTGVRSAGKDFNLDDLKNNYDEDGTTVLSTNDSATFDITVDGVTKSMTLDLTNITDDASFLTAVNDSLDTKFGAGKGEFSLENGKLTMSAEPGHTMKLTASDTVSKLGFSSNATDLTTAKTSTTSVQDALGLTAGTTFTVNGPSGSHDILIEDGMTVDAFMAKFNEGSDAQMSYNSVAGSYTVTGAKTGAINGFSFSGSDTGIFGKTPIDEVAAVDASVKIDGVSISLESNSYTYDDGTVVTFNTADPNDEISITASEDTDQAKSAIKQFVDMYNSMLQAIYDETRTTRPKSGSGALYDPLTEEESEALSSTEIEKWEEKARTGLLYKDSDLKAIESSLREVVQKSITLSDGSTFRLSDLGISLDKDYSKGGLLVIDEDKLDEVVGNTVSIDNIAEAFTNTTDGYASAMNKALNKHVGISGTLTQKVGLKSSALYLANNTMKRTITQNTYKLSDLQNMLAKKEDRYYKMFSYMETSITNSNNQLSALGLG